MEIHCVVVELLPNTAEKVQEWASFILANRVVALQSLSNEGVTVESAFVVNIDGKDYFVGYMRAADLRKAREAVQDSMLNVDAYHQAFKKACWGKRYVGKPILDLSRIPDEAEIGPG